MTSTYDARSNEVEGAYCDEAGRPTPNTDGVVGWTAAYDTRGNWIEEAYFDISGRPITNKRGFARWTAKYEGANVVDLTYFDANGMPIAVQVYVSEVLPGGQAKESGLVEGDVLVSYDGKPVRNAADFETGVNTSIGTLRLRELIVSRNGRRISFKVKPGKIGIAYDTRAARTVAKIHGTVT